MAFLSRNACLYFLIMMIISHELVCIEGRNLGHKKKLVKGVNSLNLGKMHFSKRIRKNINVASSSHLHHSIKATEGFVDAFRPTNPGHSPGVGHSIQN
ncbi:Transmembrane protein [Quillaja saponaria]|uniref:Transmembrane protein n=1 Tax=Quillaja saponaria TaxID=32244 RepID=A0AAD7KRG7_QUISA|nr:Transmembrane protein [Quillaja saponaria]